MAKAKTTAVAVTNKKNKSVAKSAAGLPAYLSEKKMTGAGVPTDQKDFLIPMAKVLDAKSPECTRGGANYVKGAEAGDFYIKNLPNPLIKGEAGFLFQPCYRDDAVIEWLPRGKGGGGGGGFVARHSADYLLKSPDKVQKPHPENKEKLIWYRKSTGNLLVETGYVGGFLINESGEDAPLPCVIPFSSTGHTPRKQWNMLMASKRLEGSKVDIWAIYYRITSMLKQRGEQAWYIPEINDAGDPDEENGAPTTFWAPTAEDYERGQQLHESLATGAKSFDVAETEVGNDDDSVADNKGRSRNKDKM